jgi:hypothetical protein
VGFVESVPAGRKHSFALNHIIVPSGVRGRRRKPCWLLDLATSLDNPDTPRM